MVESIQTPTPMHANMRLIKLICSFFSSWDTEGDMASIIYPIKNTKEGMHVPAKIATSHPIVTMHLSDLFANWYSLKYGTPSLLVSLTFWSLVCRLLTCLRSTSTLCWPIYYLLIKYKILRIQCSQFCHFSL